VTRPPSLLPIVLLVASALALVACGRTLPIENRPGDASVDTSVDTLPPECESPADCDDGIFCNGAEACLFGECVPSMGVLCDDDDACTVDSCDERLRACFYEPRPFDADGDGFPNAECGGEDCDDTRPDINPAQPELCDDGVDNDCNFAVDCADGACVFAPFCECVPRPEICDNRADDDCDGFMDCDDFDCSDTPICSCRPERESCNNGRDDDCDGLIDCRDFDCAADPLCCVPSPERCGNAVDDDCDGLVDCEDMECAGTPACSVCPDAGLGGMTGDAVATGSTVGRANSQTASCAASARSPDIAYSWTAPTTGRWTIDTIGSDFDTALHVRSGSCTGAELACDDDSGPSTQSMVRLGLMAGQTVVIIVDGWGASSSGNYVLNINMTVPELGNCDDGIDNDRDGQVDCMDLDCRMDAACVRPCPEVEIGSAEGPAVATGSTTGQGNELTPSCATSFSPDVAFGWTAPRTARYRFDTVGSSFDTILYIQDGACMGPELACDNDRAAPASRIVRNVTAGTRLVLVVDGFRISQGDYQLNIRAQEGRFCSDGVDNDLDGATDCADSECVGRPECCVPVPEICNDMVDQDCDGLVDCADPNCAPSPACCVPSPEACANGSDEDCDGLIDCVDPDCAGDPVC